jgi:hypothetical protein
MKGTNNNLKEIEFQFTPELEKMIHKIRLFSYIKMILYVLIFLLFICALSKHFHSETLFNVFYYLIGILLFISIFLRQYKISRYKYYQKAYWSGVQGKKINIKFTDDKIIFITVVTTTELTWKVAWKLHKYKHIWSLSNGYSSISIPVSCMDHETKKFIEQKVRKR